MKRFNDPTPGPRLSVSTWSVHRSLGDPAIYGPADAGIPTYTHNNGAVTLLELPARIAQHGIHTLEICHFHLPSLDAAYLAQLRKAIEDAGVEMWQVLADAGDITHPTDRERDAAWIAQWIDVAHALGAKRVRVIAGKQKPTRENLIKSRDTILRWSEKAQPLGIRLVTENWFDLLNTPDDVLWLLDQTQGQLGLCLDFGNWKGEGKYAGFEAIAPMAESCHAKPQFNADGSVEPGDYTRCLDITKAANFNGPYTLIYDGPSADEFAGLDAEKRIVQPYCI